MIEAGNSDYDIALVVLEDDIGLRLGFMNIMADVELGMRVTITGYPSDKNSQMWSSSCIINDGTDEQYYYDCDTKPGNSGSAIYTTINSNQVIIGVHDGAMEDLNYGSILTSEKVSRIEKWKKSHTKGPSVPAPKPQPRPQPMPRPPVSPSVPKNYTAVADCRTNMNHEVKAYRILGDCSIGKAEKWIYTIKGMPRKFSGGSFNSYCNSHGDAQTDFGIQMTVKWNSYKESYWKTLDGRNYYTTICR